MTNSLLSCMYIFVFCFLFVHFLLLSRLIQHSTCEKSKYEGAVPFILAQLFGNCPPIIKRVSFFLSRLHASFPWISCHFVIWAYTEAISISYMTAYLLYEFHTNPGAWVFSKRFHVNGLISCPLLYLVLSVYILP